MNVRFGINGFLLVLYYYKFYLVYILGFLLFLLVEYEKSGFIVMNVFC